MQKFVYKKRRAINTRVIARGMGLFVLLGGLVLAAYTFFPLLSYVVYIQPAFASQSFASPIPQRTVITQDSIKSLLEGTAGQLTRIGDSNWLPTLAPYKEVGVTEQLSNYSLTIPRLGIEDTYVSTTDNNVNLHLIQFPGTALPPNKGNAVIFGHSTLPQLFDPKDPHKIFATALDLRVGDALNVTVGKREYTYKVIKMSIVSAEDTSYLAQDSDGSYLSLITCTPPGTTWKRLVVKAKLAS